MSGLGQLIAPGGGIVGGWDAEQQRQNQMAIQRLQLQEQQRNAQAMAALGKYLQGNGQGGQPMAQPSAPQPMPQQPQQRPMQPPMNSPGQMRPPMGPPQGQPQMGGGQPPGPVGGGGQPTPVPAGGGGGGAAPSMPAGGGMTLDQLASQIKAKNPGIDDATLFTAVTQMSGLLNQQGMSQLDAAAKYWQHEDRLASLQERADAAKQRSEDTKLSIQERKAASEDASQTRLLIAQLVQAGQTDRQKTAIEAKKSLTEETQDRIDQRFQASLANKRVTADQKQKMAGVTDQYKALVAQRQDIDGQLQELRFEVTNAVGDRSQAAQKLTALQAKRSQINNQIVATWQGAKSLGLQLPSPADLLSGDGKGQGANAAGGAAKPSAVGATTPSGAATKYTVGQELTVGGKKYKVTGGDLDGDPDVEPVE